MVAKKVCLDKLFEKYVICEDGFGDVKNVDGKVIGFQVKVRLPYYRAVRLSFIDKLTIKIDGKEYDRNQIRFTIKEGTFTLDEMTTMVNTYWEFGEKAIVTVLDENGFSRRYGRKVKKVEIGLHLRVAYSNFFVELSKTLPMEEYLVAADNLKHIKVYS